MQERRLGLIGVRRGNREPATDRNGIQTLFVPAPQRGPMPERPAAPARPAAPETPATHTVVDEDEDDDSWLLLAGNNRPTATQAQE